MKKCLVYILSSIIAVGLLAQTKTTHHGKLVPVKPVKEMNEIQLSDVDSVTPDSIVIYSYDKPLRSIRETFLVTNHYCDTLRGITVDFVYNSIDGSMLHSRRSSIKCEIPPAETRQLYVMAWDRQYNYYYRDTRITPSHKSKAVPFTVVLTPLSVILQR